MGHELSNDQILCLCGFAFGLALLLFGLWRRHEANHLKQFPLARIPEVRFGSPASVSGLIQPVATMDSPVKRTPCVFYRLMTEHQVEVQYRDRHGRDQTRWVWRTDGDSVDGGFFVGDGFGVALVVPTLRCLDLDVGGATRTEGSMFEGSGRLTEWILEPGRTACAAGRPQGAEAFLATVTRDATIRISPDVIAHLMKLVAAGQQVPCYYLDGLDSVLDRAYADAVTYYEASGNNLIQFGGITAGAALLFLALFHFHVF
jgi:hypothetical protein